MILLGGGLSAVYLDFGPGSPVAAHLPSHGARLLLTGLLFAGTGSLVALSPIGRRSAAHLNPAVTLGFFTQRKVYPHDLAGYIVAQCLGALASVALLHLCWGDTALAVHLGATQPGSAFTALDAAGLEALMTASLVLMIFVFTSHRHLARWTPLGNWLLVATLAWLGAPYTGTSLNPARSLAPRPVGPRTQRPVDLHRGTVGRWPARCAHLQRVPRHQILTARLFDDPHYPSTLGSELPNADADVRR